MLIELIFIYYIFILIFVGFIGTLCIISDDFIYESGGELSSKKNFIRCIFMYQFALWEYLSEEINMAGMIILEILVTLSVWFLNIIIFFCLLFLLIMKGICLLFYAIFKKK